MSSSRNFDTGGRPPWMIIFTDMMLLLLTFFIILVSMSTVDEQSRVRAVESLRGVFGQPDQRFNFDEKRDAAGFFSGAQSTRPEDRPHEARQLLFADNQNIFVRYSEGKVIVELAADMLFQPGSSSLSPAGTLALDRLLPFLLNMRHPALIAGHGTPGISEGAAANLGGSGSASGSWALSAERSLSVYSHLTGRGVDKNLLLMEGFGAYRPEYDNNTAAGRRRNRRVEVVLDKRNPGLGAAFGAHGVENTDDGYIFRDFHFNLDLAPPPGLEEAR